MANTILSYQRCTRPIRCNPVALEFKGVCSCRQWKCVCYTYTAELKFSTLLEVTEAITMYVHANCTWPTRCSPVALGFQGTYSRLNF